MYCKPNDDWFICPFRWIKIQYWLVNNPQTICSVLVWKQGALNPWVDYHVPDQNEHKLEEYHPIHTPTTQTQIIWLVVWNCFFPFHIWENPSHWLSYLFKMVKTTNQLLVIYWVIYPSGFPWDPHLLMILLNFDAEISWNISTPEIPKGPEISQRSPEISQRSPGRASHEFFREPGSHRNWAGDTWGRMVVLEHRMRI